MYVWIPYLGLILLLLTVENSSLKFIISESESNVLYPVIGHSQEIRNYFHILKSNKIYNNHLALALKKLIFE